MTMYRFKGIWLKDWDDLTSYHCCIFVLISCSSCLSPQEGLSCLFIPDNTSPSLTSVNFLFITVVTVVCFTMVILAYDFSNGYKLSVILVHPILFFHSMTKVSSQSLLGLIWIVNDKGQLGHVSLSIIFQDSEERNLELGKLFASWSHFDIECNNTYKDQLAHHPHSIVTLTMIRDRTVDE